MRPACLLAVAWALLCALPPASSSLRAPTSPPAHPGAAAPLLRRPLPPPDPASDAPSSPLATPAPPGYVARAPPGLVDREAIRAGLLRSLFLSDAARGRLAGLEQGSQEWLDARANRLTASNFGAAAGHNRYKSPAQLVHDMLYGGFEGNDATRWGSAHEQVACDEYALAMRARRGGAGGGVQIRHSGLNVHPDMHWLAVSPDGHVRGVGGGAGAGGAGGDEGADAEGILEIKCPYSRRLYGGVPPYYSDQLQGLMGVLGARFADFCVWTPSEISVQRVQFDQSYWDGDLLPALRTFYFSLFVPAYVEREARRMQGDFSAPPVPR